MLTVFLTACGGGGGNADTTSAPGAPSPSPAAPAPPAVSVEKPATRSEASRFLTQATFGPVDADINRLMDVGYAAWIDEQLALPADSHRSHVEARDAQIKAANASSSAGQDQVFETFWKQALTSRDQLRQRTVFALSQIFVISMADDNVVGNPRAVAAWLDMLGAQGLGNYRELLESVSRHPMMGIYLSHLRNRKADYRTGRVPDENYAREVMQLFSIGLVALNEDGSAREVGGQPLDSYTPDDISGMARVFTGWSWACPDWPDNSCFSNGAANGASDPDRSFKAMLAYPQYHSTEEKRFLGATVAAQDTSDPAASLRVALDTLANHPNVGPFIGRQLIQRLVTSNPSPTYVRDVARVWADNGSGVRGDMKAVVKAVLMHREARTVSDTSGKVREPVLKLSAFLRAFPHTSDTGFFRVGSTDPAGTALGQSPMRSPSVFNFYRPGYVAPGTAAAARSLQSPEMQIAHETSVAGYVNFMRDNIASGVGQVNGVVDGVTRNRRDLQGDYSAELALAANATDLVDRVLAKLVVGPVPTALRTELIDTVGRINIPTLNATFSNQSSVDNAKRARVNSAILLTVVSPEFQVQP
ncbi:MAG: DUF1800 domain-containing protein [Rubrivivax sp.]|nr:DUF1800 domain-containing protein [Rubrivivax sp.]